MTEKTKDGALNLLAETEDSTRKMATLKEGKRYNVFLGGSCGGTGSPTTWRAEIAIPFLEAHNFAFYNPQVKQWSQELVEKEKLAKEKSDWLLFMLESSTRGISSLVEIAYLVGKGRSVIVILQEDRRNGQFMVADDEVTALESKDIIAAQNILSRLMSKEKESNCVDYSTLEQGLQHVANNVPKNKNNNYTVQECSQSNKNKTEKVKRNWQQWLSGAIDIFTQSKASENGKRTNTFDLGIIGHGKWDHTEIFSKLNDKTTGNTRTIYDANDNDADVIESLMRCKVVLAVIPSDSLSCANMCKVAFIISNHPKLILHIEQVNETVDNGNTSLSTDAVKDFNRGRTYLANMAKGHNVSQHNKYEEAVISAIAYTKNPSNSNGLNNSRNDLNMLPMM